MGDAEADRTQDRPTLRALDDEDVAEALRTCQTPAVDEYTLGEEMPTTPALPEAECEAEATTEARAATDADVAPTVEGTQEIHVDDVLEVLEGRRRPPMLTLPPPAPRARPVDRTQEIRAVDILEEHPAAPVAAAAQCAEPTDIPIDVGEVEDTRSTASSIAPFALEIELPHLPHRAQEPSDSSGTSEVSFATRVKPTRRLRAIVEITMAASLLIIAAGAVRAHLSPTSDEPPTIVLPAAAAAPLRPAPDAKPAEPLATTGTLTRATRAKLTVDGVPITAPSALVPCGPHLVKVGAEKAHTVDVPCGGSVTIDQARK
jgi:hypothetical protein